MKKMNFASIAVVTMTIVLILGFIAFEAFNLITTQVGLEMIMGSTTMALVLAIAVTCVDLGALSRVLTPQQGREEPAIIKVLTLVWLFVAAFSASMTWWVLEVRFETTAPRAPAVMQEWLWLIPVMLAILVFVVHVTMIYTLGVYLDLRIHNGRRVGTPIGNVLHQGKPTVRTAVPEGRTSWQSAPRPAPQQVPMQVERE